MSRNPQFNVISHIKQFSHFLFTFAYIVLTTMRYPTRIQAEELPLTIGGFLITRVYLTIPEELTPGSTIIDLSVHPQVKQVLNNYGTTTFQYRLLNMFDVHLFRLTPNFGQLTVATRLDRESLCASPKAQFCCKPRSRIPQQIPAGIDWNQTENVPNSQLCHLVVHVSIQPDTKEEMSRTKAEQNTVYSTQLAFIYLYIRLEDINDHTPQFHSAPSSLNVPEDTSIGSMLHFFRISDPDTGPNGLNEVNIQVKPVSNQIHDPQHQSSANQYSKSASVAQPFEVRIMRDGTSLILNNSLDRETIPTYDVKLIASDWDAISPRTSQMNIRIHITDINDNRPIWVSKSDTKISKDDEMMQQVSAVESSVHYNVSVREDTQIGSLIIWLQATDADSGDNSRLQYFIDSSSPNGQIAMDYFTIQSNTGEVRLKTRLDFDSIPSHVRDSNIEVPLIVHDSPRSERKLSTKSTLFVHILDVNDVAPIILVSPISHLPGPNSLNSHLVSPMSNFFIRENQPPGQPIASILVTDPDTGAGGRVSCQVKDEYFALTGEIGKSFTNSEFFEPYSDLLILNGPLNFQLITTRTLDREQKSRHHVVISCQDHDSIRPLSSTKRLDIDVLDENDNEPKFSFNVFELSCHENEVPGQLIGKLNVTDRDVGENAQLHFWIDEPNVNWVTINAQTGEVRTSVMFDREAEVERQFTVFVSDRSTEKSHTSSTLVKVHILDVNDHSPQFSDLYFFTIPENCSPGTEVGYVKADDDDEGDNGKVHYYLRYPSREFELNRETGRLTVRQTRTDGITNDDLSRDTILDREQQDKYELTVIAEDSGEPPRYTSTVIHIGLSDVNDHSPQFLYPNPHGPGSVLNVSCAQLSSQVIARVQANDSDEGKNAEIEYSLVRQSSDNSKQRIHRRSTDSSIVQSNISHSRTVEKKSSPVSPDMLSNVDFLQGGPTPDHFEINSYNGQLFLIHPILDCSRPTKVRLIIQAKDDGVPSRSSTALLTIYVYPTEQPQYPYVDDTTKKFKSNVGDIVAPNAAWHSRQIKNKPSGNSIGNANHLSTSFIGSSHWSIILGLIIAMVVLVVLLCLMLILLRRRFLYDEQKVSNRGEFNAGANYGKTQMCTSALRVTAGSRGTICYSEDPHGDHSLHELTGSPQQHSVSPTLLSQIEELNGSNINLELNPGHSGNTRYVCTMPPVWQHENDVKQSNDASIKPMSHPIPNHVLYKTSTGDLYGYFDHLPNTRGHAYQTLLPNMRTTTTTTLTRPYQDRTTMNTFSPKTSAAIRSDRVGEKQLESMWTDPMVAANRTKPHHNHYTPLIATDGTNTKQKKNILFQASQPDLVSIGGECESVHGQCDSETKDMNSIADRALSLTNLLDVGQFKKPLNNHTLPNMHGNQQSCHMHLSHSVMMENCAHHQTNPYSSASFV